MSNEYFKFKQFTVYHDRCAMKVGTDGVLLGAWAPTGSRILDIGTGTGLISLMLAQRCGDSLIDAIEIDEDAALQARDNADSSDFGKRINIFHTSLQDFTQNCIEKGNLYDSIVSNPPFYTEDTACPESKRHSARHTESLSYNDLCRCASQLLAKGGSFSVIVPSTAKDNISFEAGMNGLFIKNICHVRTVPRKVPKRIMITFSNTRDNDVFTEEQNLMNADGTRSEWYNNITSDFYLW